MAKANINSIDMSEGDKIAAYGNQKKQEMKKNLKKMKDNPKDQVINARKSESQEANKAKRKKRAKMAKASRRKNK